MKKRFVACFLLFINVIFLLTSCNNKLSNPLILGGKPFVDHNGKAYSKEEAAFIESLGITFNTDKSRHWNNLDGIEQLVNLTELDIYGNNLDTIDFSSISLLSKLEKLFIEGNITQLPDLTGLENLYSIIIDYKYSEGTRLKNLYGIGAPNLTEIEIRNENDIESLSPLNNLLCLKKMKMCLSEKNEYSIAHMSNLPSLEQLELDHGKINVQGIENMTMLKHLRFYECEPFNIEYIGNLKNLETLLLNITAPEPSLTFLKNLSNLEILQLQSNNNRYKIQDEIERYQILDVKPIASLNNLEHLFCNNFIIKNIASLDVLDKLQPYDFTSVINLLGCSLYNRNDLSQEYYVYDEDVSRHVLIFKLEPR